MQLSPNILRRLTHTKYQFSMVNIYCIQAWVSYYESILLIFRLQSTASSLYGKFFSLSSVQQGPWKPENLNPNLKFQVRSGLTIISFKFFSGNPKKTWLEASSSGQVKFCFNRFKSGQVQVQPDLELQVKSSLNIFKLFGHSNHLSSFFLALFIIKILKQIVLWKIW